MLMKISRLENTPRPPPKQQPNLDRTTRQNLIIQELQAYLLCYTTYFAQQLAVFIIVLII